jgi:hypothetical protein
VGVHGVSFSSLVRQRRSHRRVHELGGEGEEVAQEEEGEVPEVSRRLYLRGASGIDVSNLSAGIEALAQRSAVKRRAIMTV